MNTGMKPTNHQAIQQREHRDNQSFTCSHLSERDPGGGKACQSDHPFTDNEMGQVLDVFE